MMQIRLQTLVIAAFLVCCGCGGVARKGKADARADLASGKLAIETAGLPAPWNATYVRLLRERHHIEVRSVAGCIVDEETLQHMDAYNSVMKDEIARRFGKDILERTADEAQRLGP